MTTQKPKFMMAAEEVAKARGLRPEEILEEDRERVLTPDYPGPDCLDPAEVESLLGGESGDFAEAVEEHVSRCSACLALLYSASGSDEELERILSLVRRLRRERGIAVPVGRRRVTSSSYAIERG